MAIRNEETTTFARLMKQKYLARRSGRSLSFSAKLPADVGPALQERCVCAVKNSKDPVSEIRESIVEVVEEMGVRDWKEMEDLVYCYIVLNSTEIHHFIKEAFLSLRFDSRS